MAELTKEQYDSLPDFIKGDYEQSGDNYRSKAEGKAAALKNSLNSLNEKFTGISGELEQFKATQAQAIEQARKEGLEQARSKGDIHDVERRYQEQMEHLKNQASDSQAQHEARIKELEGIIKNSKRGELLASLKSKLAVFDDCSAIFDRIVGVMIDVDPNTGKRIYLSESGGATSLDDAGFLAHLEKDPAIARLRKANPPSSGGMATGGQNVSGGATRKFNEFSGEELAELRKTKPQEYARLRNEYYGTGGK